jgi:hypothetical protein
MNCCYFVEVVSKPHLPAKQSGISHRIERLIKGLKRPNGCVVPRIGILTY